MMLSKSKYCRGLQCKKRLWLETYKPEVEEDVNNENILDNGKMIGILAKDLFGPHIDILYDENLDNMLNKTKNILLVHDNVVLTEASFVYDDNFCSVDLLRKNNENYEIFEVKSSTQVSENYIDDITYQTYILSNLGYNITGTYIVTINRDYVRHGELDIQKLFAIKNVTYLVAERILNIENNIKEIKDYLKQSNEPGDMIGTHCLENYDCPFFKYCTKHLPDKNVFDIRGMKLTQKIDLYNKGLYAYEDLLKEKINNKYKQQIEFELFNKEPIINIPKLKEFMNQLTYPLYFLDFETYQPSIPNFDNITPYTQVPFQYSIHFIESENSPLEHYEFLAEADVDPRRDLAERLVKDIPLNVCTLAYNMRFEKMVIRDLANLFPDLKEHLMNIHDNMKDLMVPFKNRDYYVKEMDGSFSIKKVLPALFPNDPSLDYNNLEQIHKGTEASSSFENLGSLPKEEQEKVRNNLLKYCGLDTYAMVKIWEKIREVITNDNDKTIFN